MVDEKGKVVGIKDLPWDELIAACAKHAEEGKVFFLKFTCSNCGARNMIEDANILYTTGSCDKCHLVTNITEVGGGYALLIPTTPEGQADADRLVAKTHERVSAKLRTIH